MKLATIFLSSLFVLTLGFSTTSHAESAKQSAKREALRGKIYFTVATIQKLAGDLSYAKSKSIRSGLIAKDLKRSIVKANALYDAALADRSAVDAEIQTLLDESLDALSKLSARYNRA